MGDPSPAALDQLFDRHPRAARVIRDEGDGVGVRLGEGIDDGDAEIGEIDGQMPVDALAGGDNAVDLLVQHGLDMELAEARIVFDIAQEKIDTPLSSKASATPAITGSEKRP